MEKQPRTRRIEYRLVLWTVEQGASAAIWQGMVETVSGQQFQFRTLTELDQILYELAGWMDPPTAGTPEPPRKIEGQIGITSDSQDHPRRRKS